MDDLNALPDDLRRALEALDARSARRARAVDPARIAQQVVARLRTEPIEMPADRRRHWTARPVARAAAAAVLLLVGGVLVRQRLAEGPTATASLPVGVVAESALADDGGVVATAVDSLLVVNARDTAASIVSVEDLTVTELETLLSELSSGSEGEL
jgi:hypothetical protein